MPERVSYPQRIRLGEGDFVQGPLLGASDGRHDAGVSHPHGLTS